MKAVKLVTPVAMAILFLAISCAEPAETPGAPTPAPTPSPPLRAEFEIASLDIAPPEIMAGEAVTITAEVKNTGGSEGTYTVILTVEGLKVNTEDVTVAAGATERVMFSLVKDAPGTYQIGIGGLTSNLTVKEKPIAEELDVKIHKDAWSKFVSNAEMDEYYKYAIYATRILVVKHPEVYLQGDDIFIKAITTSPGFERAYEIKDVHSEYMYTEEAELDGASFCFEIVEFSKYALISAKEIYPDSYPVLAFLDRRLAPISTALKTFHHKITQLEKAEQLYFKEKLAGYGDLYLIYCDNENTYLYRDGLLISMKNGEAKNVDGNPILIFNEQWVWYPLMDRDDTKRDEVLRQLVTTYSTEIDKPVLSEFETSMIDKLKNVTEIETTEQGLATLKIASIHLSGMARDLLIKHLNQQFPPFIPSRTFNEFSNLISPASAYLAAIGRQVGGEKGIKAICDEYLRYASTPAQQYWAHGHPWFYWMDNGGLEFSYRTHGGGCYVQAGNIGAALWLAHIDHYRMAGFTFWKESWGGHDFIYIPDQDLILSNGKIEDLEDTVIDYADDTHRESPFKYLHFIEHRGKWVGIGGNYFGTLSPNDVLGIFTYLREIHGDDIQAGKIVNNQLVPVPFDELKRNLEAEQGKWKPYELPPLNSLNASPDFLGPKARELYTFEQIVPLLNTADKVSIFMQNNIKWDGSYDLRTAGTNEYVPAWVVYENGIDDCDGHAIIQSYFLKANGYDAFIIGIGIEGPEGHNVCVYLNDGWYWMLDNCGTKKGPFKSLDELGDSVISGASIIIFNPLDITSPTRNPFQLPHKVYRSSP